MNDEPGGDSAAQSVENDGSSGLDAQWTQAQQELKEREERERARAASEKVCARVRSAPRCFDEAVSSTNTAYSSC